MEKIKILTALFVSVLLFTGVISNIEKESTIQYPTGYRNWVHVKSGVVGPGSPAAPKYEGITHIYANEAAMMGYRTGKFPQGAIIVFDVLESNVGKNGINEGKRKFIDVMVRDTVLYASTGGWGFEEFDTTSTAILTEVQKRECFNCHQSQKGRDFVFSGFRE